MPILQARKLLTKLEVDPNNQFYSSFENVLYDKAYTTVKAIPGGVPSAKIHPTATTIEAQAGSGTSIKVFDCKESKNLKYIQSEAFKGSQINYFIFPSSILEIGSMSFYSCSSIDNISFVSGCNIKSLGSSAFRYSSVKRVELADSIETFNSFCDCYQLQDFIISENSKLSSIQDSAFSMCSKLKNFTIYPNLRTIGVSSFSDCKSLVVDFSRCQLTSIGSGAFQNCASIKNIILPSTLTSLGSSAFLNCAGATSLTFDPNIQISEFGSSAFANCTSLKSVELPTSLSKIDYSIFHGCKSLSKLTVKSNNINLKTVDDVIYDIQGSTLICCAFGKDIITIIDGISEIKGNAFFQCSSLKKVTFPSICYVKAIKINTFAGCVKLESIEIPPSVEVLESGAFSGCDALSSVKFGEGSNLVTIGEGTFSSCKNLTKVLFGDSSSLATISPRAFSGCSLLEVFTFPDSLQTIGDSAFSGTGIKNVEFGANSIINYEKNSFNGMEALEKFTFSPNTKSIPSGMFSGCNLLHSIVFPKNCKVEEIPQSAFINAVNLGRIVFADSTKYIRDSAFEGLKNLSSVSGIERIIEIGSKSFYGTNLQSVSLSSVNKLGESSFESCINLVNAILYKTVESIPRRCFAGCTSLRRFDSAKVRSIGEEAFAGTGFTEIDLAESVSEIGPRCFNGCTRLKTAVVRAKSASIESKAFAGCDNLAAVKFCGTEVTGTDDVFMNSEYVVIYVPVYFKGAVVCGKNVVPRLGDDCGLLPSVMGDGHYPEVNSLMLAAVIAENCSDE